MTFFNRFISTSFCVLMGIAAASAQYSVRGEVVDSTGLGEPYATIRIYHAADTAKAVTMGVTAEDGTFHQALTRTGSYRLSVTSVGKQEILRTFEITTSNPDIDLGRMVTRVADNLLGEVEVVAQKPLVTAEIDRLSYDVASDEDSKTNSILEMLKKVPMVTVDGQDNIKVNGNSNFKIYKNGRPDNTLSGNPSQVLKSIPASMVKKIEVITEPGAKYDAEGVSGILNIVMEDNSRIDGVMGNIYAQYNTLNQPGGNVYLTTSFNDKLTTSVNYSYIRIGENKAFNESAYTYKESGNNEHNYQETESPGHFHYGSLDMSYEIDTLNLVTASVSGYYVNVAPNGYNTTQSFDSDGNKIYSMRQVYDNGQQYGNHYINARLDYQHLTHHKGEAVNFSYLLSSSGNDNQYISTYDELYNPPFDYTHYVYDTDQKLMEHTFQLDWTRPINDKHKLDFGAKYIFRRNHSETTTQYDDQTPLLSDFMHRTHVGAVYGEYSFTSGAWMARAGVRYEFSRMTADYRNSDRASIEKNLNDVVPTLSLGYRFNDQHSVKANFSTRINRPGLGYLDPAENRSIAEVSFGNPALVSARTNSVQGTYTLIHPKLTLNATLGHSFSNDQITQFRYAANDVRYNTYDNIGKTRQTYLNVYAQWLPAKTTSISFNGNLAHGSYQSDNLGIKNSRWSFGFYAHASQQLPWKLRFSISGGRNDWGLNDLYTYNRPTYFYMLGLQRSFLKDDRLTLQVFAMNPFSSRRQTFETITAHGDYTGYQNNRYLHRMVQVCVSFNFGSLKASVKKTRTTINNDDVVGSGNNTPSQTQKQ